MAHICLAFANRPAHIHSHTPRHTPSIEARFACLRCVVLSTCTGVAKLARSSSLPCSLARSRCLRRWPRASVQYERRAAFLVLVFQCCFCRARTYHARGRDIIPIPRRRGRAISTARIPQRILHPHSCKHPVSRIRTSVQPHSSRLNKKR